MTSRWQELRWYVLSALATLGLTIAVMRLYRAEPHIPLAYQGDGLVVVLQTKGILENGWYLQNESLGAPWGMDLTDFPMSDTLHFAAFKGIGLLARDPGLTVNLYFLLTFPLAALTALFALRRLGTSAPVAVFCAILFALLPYHFWRGPHHLFLSAYYLIPPAVLIALGLLRASGERAWRPLGRGTSLVLCLLIASAGVYYAFFSCFLWLASGLLGTVRRWRWAPLLRGSLLTAVVTLGVLLNISPSLARWAKQGRNEESVQRNAGHAEHYGLKIAQLVLPVSWHRIPALARLRADYNLKSPCINDNSSSSLGAIGTLGFLGLVSWMLLRQLGAFRRLAIPDDLGLLTLLALLLGTLGGFGAVFGLLVSSWIRGYNRISIFIAFFCLAAVAWALDWLSQRIAATPRRQRIFASVLAVLLLVGVCDQTTNADVPPYVDRHRRYRDDARFVERIEETLSSGAMVLQFPLVRFPEEPTLHGMPDYEHFRLPLHSRHLRWSYGAVKGQESDSWHESLRTQSLARQIEAACLLGFEGLTITRAGYADQAAQGEQELRDLIGPATFASEDGGILFYDLRPYATQLRAKLGTEAHTEAARRARDLPRFHWDGFGAVERQGTNSYRWCSWEGRLILENPGDSERQVTLTMTLRAASMKTAQITVRGLGRHEELVVDHDGSKTPWRLTLTVPPGRHDLVFSAAGEHVAIALPPHYVVFRLQNLGMEVDPDD